MNNIEVDRALLKRLHAFCFSAMMDAKDKTWENHASQLHTELSKCLGIGDQPSWVNTECPSASAVANPDYEWSAAGSIKPNDV